jgi:hypothetical protein
LGAENEADAESTLKMTDVIHTLSAAATRVIVFNPKTQTPIYVIRSTSPPMPANWVTSDYAEGPALPKDAKLKEYLDVKDNRTDARKFRFIAESATPDAALALMIKEGVDDLFITKDGQPTSPVLGGLPRTICSRDSLDRKFEMPFLQQGRVVRGVVQGDSIPQEFIPKLVDLIMDGKFPIEKMIKFYDFADINKAAAESSAGIAIKPVLRMPAG